MSIPLCWLATNPEVLSEHGSSSKAQRLQDGATFLGDCHCGAVPQPPLPSLLFPHPLDSVLRTTRRLFLWCYINFCPLLLLSAAPSGRSFNSQKEGPEVFASCPLVPASN